MRSLLFVPADDEKKQAKALNSETDAIILDMEDSVSLKNKVVARDVVKEFFAQTSTEKIIIVRINALDTEFWRDDMAVIADLAPDYILVPKARSGEDIATINALIEKSSNAANKTKIIALVTETPESIFNMASFKNCANRLSALTWGAEDLSAEIGAQTNKDQNGVYFPVYQLARSWCLLGASNAEVSAIDSVFTNFKDDDGLRAEAIVAKTEGFWGKMIIHPRQIKIVNEVFTVSDSEIAHAKEVIDAIENSKMGGVAQLNGEMIDQPHYKRALRVVMRQQK